MILKMTESNTFFAQESMVFYQPIEDVWLTLVDMHSYWKWNPILKDVWLPKGLLYCAPMVAKYSVFSGITQKKGRIGEIEEKSQLSFAFYRFHPKFCSENWQIRLVEKSDLETEVSIKVGYSGWFCASAWQNDVIEIEVACDVFMHALKQTLEET